MARVRATTKLNSYNPTALVAYASSITAAMLTNVGTFPTPPIALATINTAIANLVLAIAAWGPVGARGSHADLLNLRSATKSVQVALQVTASYVNIVAVGNAPTIALSGFTSTNPHSVIGVLTAPQNFRQLVTGRTLAGQAILKWKKPLNAGFGKIGTYIVEAQDPDTFLWSQAAAVTRTKATVNYPGAQPQAHLQANFRVYAVNSAGNGATTADLLTTFAI